MNQFMGVMTDPFIAGRGDAATAGGGPTGYADEEALAYAARKRNPNDALAAIYTKASPMAPFQQRWSVWADGYGGSQTTDGNTVTGPNNTTSRIYGTAIGADYRFSPFTIAGFSLAGGGTSFGVANNGTGRSEAADSALVTASAETKWVNGWSTAATFEGEFSNVTRSYAGKGVVRYAW